MNHLFKDDVYFKPINRFTHYESPVIIIYTDVNKPECAIQFIFKNDDMYIHLQHYNSVFSIELNPFEFEWNSFKELYKQQRCQNKFMFSFSSPLKQDQQQFIDKVVDNISTKELKHCLFNMQGV